MKIRLGNTLVTLLPEHAVFLEETGTLIAADIHLGKSATFRKRGIPIPEGDTLYDLDVLSKLISRTGARRLVIAGDLVHAKDGMSSHVLETFREWTAGISLPIVLTEGNHDKMALLSRHEIAIEIVPSINIEGLRITHDPEELMPDVPGIAGHLHPGAKVVESPRRSIRVPAFYLIHPHHLVLPAFSRFTGMNRIKPERRDRFFIPLQEKVMELPTKVHV